MTTKSEPLQPPEDLDWVQLRKELSDHGYETAREKFKRKFNSNPLVPIGCLATTFALGYGLWAFRAGNNKLSQTMMRCRVAAQGFTIIALVTGVILTARAQ